VRVQAFLLTPRWAVDRWLLATCVKRVRDGQMVLTPPTVVEAKDLLEVIDDRSQVRSMVVVGQLPVDHWHAALATGDPTT
jgi:hypothetical protein